MRKLSWQGQKIAAEDARTTKEDDKVGWCSSGGVMLAVANHLTAVVATDGGRAESTEDKKGLAEVWV